MPRLKGSDVVRLRRGYSNRPLPARRQPNLWLSRIEGQVDPGLGAAAESDHAGASRAGGRFHGRPQLEQPEPSCRRVRAARAVVVTAVAIRPVISHEPEPRLDSGGMSCGVSNA